MTRQRLDNRRLCAEILAEHQICQLCSNANATEVHVITYAEGRTEFRALCYECHKMSINPGN